MTLSVPPPLDDGRPFTRRQALGLGVTARSLEGPRYVRMLPGVYRCASVEPDLRTWVGAARLVLPPDARASHTTAMRLHGVRLGSAFPVQMSVIGGTAPERGPVLWVHRRHRVPPNDGQVVDPVPAWVDCCRRWDLAEAVAAAEDLLHRGVLTPAQLDAGLERASCWAGVVKAREARALVRVGSESVRESYQRLVIVLAGLPEPECNADVVVDGRFVARGDLVYRRWRTIIEYDGRQHAEDTYQWNRDLDRHDGLQAVDWAAVRVTDRRLRRPREVVDRVHRTIAARGYRGPAPTYDERWVDLFERRTVRRLTDRGPF